MRPACQSRVRVLVADMRRTLEPGELALGAFLAIVLFAVLFTLLVGIPERHGRAREHCVAVPAHVPHDRPMCYFVPRGIPAKE